MSPIPTETIEKILSDEHDVREATSTYQAEFPYERTEEAQVTRREFCNFLFLTSSALLVSTGSFATKAAYDAGKVHNFEPLLVEGASVMEPGTALNFRYPNEDETAILVRAKDGNYYAYGQKCTHLTCPVFYAKESDRLECPCHEGGFDIKTGNVLYGPPPRPLDRVLVEVRGSEVWAIGFIRGGGENEHA